MDFFDKFLGQWMTKKNIFILKYNLKYTYEEQIKVTKNEDSNLLYDYQLINENASVYLKGLNYVFEKKNQISTNEYKIQKINKNLLKINQIINENTYYTEYMYFIHDNFNTSIGFIKKNNNYLATIFTSYIKFKNKKN